MQICNYYVVKERARGQNLNCKRTYANPVGFLEEDPEFQAPWVLSGQVASTCSLCGVPEISTAGRSRANQSLCPKFFKKVFYLVALVIQERQMKRKKKEVIFKNLDSNRLSYFCILCTAFGCAFSMRSYCL